VVSVIPPVLRQLVLSASELEQAADEHRDLVGKMRLQMRLLANAEAPHVPAHVIVIESRDAKGAIAQLADEIDATLIVVPRGWNTGRLGRFLFGSAADRLAREARRPVLVAQPAIVERACA
jgi:nucleotide-binding universal stress UspA family protein